MFDSTQVCPRLAAQFIAFARRAAAAGHAVGSTSEQIVGALLNGRADWLPEQYPKPLDAINRLVAGGEGWWHTMLAVNDIDWRDYGEWYEAEAL